MTANWEAISASAHEIEGSLRAISKLADGMSQEANEQSGPRQTVDAMKAEAAHAHDALLPLLDLSQESQASWSVHNLNSLLSSVVAASGLNTTGSGVKATLQLDPGEPRVWCDEERMRQVFVNLIANALDAMPQKGVLTVSTKVVGNTAEVRFADTGVGVPPEHLERVFDAFFTSKPAERGSGLGLASSRMTVERHRGTISVESEVGKGTTVVIRLPAQPGD
jgi:signal transduction histidine kinase